MAQPAGADSVYEGLLNVANIDTQSRLRVLQAITLCEAVQAKSNNELHNELATANDSYCLSSEVEHTALVASRTGSNDQQYLKSFTTDRLFVAFRGTSNVQDLFTDLNVRPKILDFGRVHRGFYSRSKTINIVEIVKLAIENDVEAITFTGHSLGGAVAILCTIKALHYCNTISSNLLIDCITFGAPNVGDADVRYHLINVKKYFLNFVNRDDCIPDILNLKEEEIRLLIRSVENVTAHIEHETESFLLAFIIGVGSLYALCTYVVPAMIYVNVGVVIFLKGDGDYFGRETRRDIEQQLSEIASRPKNISHHFIDEYRRELVNLFPLNY